MILTISIILLSAIIVDFFVADMKLLSRFTYHPVQWVGYLAIFLEKKLNHGNAITQFLSGSLISLSLLFIVYGFAHFLMQFADESEGAWAGYFLSGFFLSWLIASRSLCDYVYQIVLARDDLPEARKRLSHIVGRKTETLDEDKISRASIETLAENFSDAVVAPLFYFAMFSFIGLGLEGLFLYKTLNTLDSLYGYRNKRYVYFGKLPAILDDIVNLIPARLTACLIFGAGLFFAPKHFLSAIYQSFKGIKPIWRYYFLPNNGSPNACWTEWAFATLLNVELGGKREYQGGIIQENTIGLNGKTCLAFDDITRALKLYRYSMLLLSGILGLIIVFLTFSY